MKNNVRSSLVVVMGLLIGGHAAFAQIQSWDKQLSSSRRFVVLEAFQGAAVLDKETGLVWQRSADRNRDGAVTDLDRVSWLNALFVCRGLEVGNRKGWRLPTIDELSTLTDPSTANPALPGGHPFEIPSEPDQGFWSANTYVGSAALALAMFPASGLNSQMEKFMLQHVLCVRGGSGVDPQ